MGYVAFIVAYTVLQPFGVPGSIFIVAAPLIWPWQTAFALAGLAIASLLIATALFLADTVAGRSRGASLVELLGQRCQDLLGLLVDDVAVRDDDAAKAVDLGPLLELLAQGGLVFDVD